MKKRNIILVGTALLAVILVGTTVYIHLQPAATAKSLSYGMMYADAKRMPLATKCLEKNSTLTISAGDRSTVEQVAMLHLYDVPAGTNVDVLIASYTKDQVTGSEHYPAKYGSYSFTMHKQSNGDWHFTKFEHCY